MVKVKRTMLWDGYRVNEYCIKVEGVNLAIITWTEIIEMLKQVASSVDVKYLPDIVQLEGFCNQLDSDAFLPFVAEDLSAEMAKKEERYYQVVDEVIELLHADNSIITSKKGLKATGYRKGYTRSLIINEYSITLNYDRDLWKSPTSVETPFWVAIRNKEWEQTLAISENISQFAEQRKEKFWNMTFLSLEALQNATFSEVCENMKDQILLYLSIINNI